MHVTCSISGWPSDSDVVAAISDAAWDFGKVVSDFRLEILIQLARWPAWRVRQGTALIMAIIGVSWRFSSKTPPVHKVIQPRTAVPSPIDTSGNHISTGASSLEGIFSIRWHEMPLTNDWHFAVRAWNLSSSIYLLNCLIPFISLEYERVQSLNFEPPIFPPKTIIDASHSNSSTLRLSRIKSCVDEF